MKPKALRVRKERNEIKVSYMEDLSVPCWRDFHLSVDEAERLADKIEDAVADLRAQQRRDDFDVVLDEAMED